MAKMLFRWVSGLTVGFGFSVLLILGGTRHEDDTGPFIESQKSNTRNDVKVEYHLRTFAQLKPTPYNESVITEKILNRTRTKIKTDLSQYNFSEFGTHGLENLIMEKGGKPLQSLILTTWRSGSTFLGSMLKAIPGTFFHYEPLHKLGVIQVRGSPYFEEASNVIIDMFKCNYANLEDYLWHATKNVVQLHFNPVLWDRCKSKRELCSDANFTSQVCQLFPFQSMKVVRLRLRLIKRILEDKELNVKVILLVRDPRAVMQSRKSTEFCLPHPDCWDPSLLCADMISDYVAAIRILHQYPDRLKVFRFEELALEPNITGRQILKFLRLSAGQWFEKFVRSYTNKQRGGISSIYRVSRTIPFKWKKESKFSKVYEIQMMCKQAMSLWGYNLAHNESHMRSKDFIPIRDYVLSSL